MSPATKIWQTDEIEALRTIGTVRCWRDADQAARSIDKSAIQASTLPIGAKGFTESGLRITRMDSLTVMLGDGTTIHLGR